MKNPPPHDAPEGSSEFAPASLPAGRIRTAGDHIDMGFLRARTDIFRLRQSVLGQAGVKSWTETPEADGLYGGVQVLAAFQPSGSGSTLAEEKIGPTSENR